MTTLVEPAIALSRGTPVVVKLGGKSVETPEGRARLADGLAALVASGARLVIVHGGGAQVTQAMAAAGLQPTFVNGLRVTDTRTLDVAEPVFTYIGKTLAHALTTAGAPAVGLTGRDANLVRATVKDAALGRVGTVTSIDAELLRHLVFNGITPVVGPIAVDDDGALNVNADEVASAVATALHAKELLLLTDVPAVRDGNGSALVSLTPDAARALIDSGVANGGMVPKINGALAALESGVPRVRVLDESGLGKLAAGEEAGTTFGA